MNVHIIVAAMVSIGLFAFENPAIAQSIDQTLWKTYDEGGWERFDQREYATAKNYFAKAQSILRKQSAADSSYDTLRVHRGRSTAGQAWVEYRLTAKKVNENRDTNIDANSYYRSAQSKATLAVSLLKEPLPKSETKYRAYALHVLALTCIELSDGAAAEKHLEEASKIYLDIEDTKRYFDALHVLGKLRQCSRDLVGAARKYSKILKEASNPERRLAALVDLANTLSWLGEYRTAWELRSQWRQLEKELPDPKPVQLLFRAKLVFARIGILYGDFEQSELLLTQACAELDDGNHSSICQNVYWILVAELAVARGNLEEAKKSQSNVALDGEMPVSGYGCIEVVAVDAACRQSVIETCTYEVICFDACCCCRPAYRVLFTEQTEKLQAMDVNRLFALIWDSLAGRIQISEGDFRGATATLRRVRSELDSILRPGSPVTITPIIELARALQLQKRDSTEIRNLLVASLNISRKLEASEHAVRADVLESLGNWRLQISEYDLASELYLKAMKHGQFVRAEDHPAQGVLLVKHIEATAIVNSAVNDTAVTDLKNDEAIKTGTAKSQEKPTKISTTEHLMASRDALVEVRSSFERGGLNCYDYRFAEINNVSAWICFFLGDEVHSHRSFVNADKFWVEREKKLEVKDTRRASAALGMVATMAEMQTPETDPGFQKTWEHYLRLAILQCEQNMVAHELNRMGIALRRAGHLHAAKFLCTKSADFYKSQGSLQEESTVRTNIDLINKLLNR